LFSAVANSSSKLFVDPADRGAAKAKNIKNRILRMVITFLRPYTR
jgi:hypothetical protein